MLEDDNKDSSLASIVSSSNMATTSLSFDSLGIDYKPSISLLPLRRTHLGPAPTVHLKELSALEGDEVND